MKTSRNFRPTYRTIRRIALKFQKEGCGRYTIACFDVDLKTFLHCDISFEKYLKLERENSYLVVSNLLVEQSEFLNKNSKFENHKSQGVLDVSGFNQSRRSEMYKLF